MYTVSPMRVLVVDDSEDAGITMAFLLKRLGHEAVVAMSGEAALQQAPLFRPDVMFIDLAMPQIDGLNLAQQLRQTPEFAETPLVAVSGFVDVEHRAEATAAGFTDFLAKPYPLDVLEGTLARLRARIDAGRSRAEESLAAVERSRRLAKRSRQGLDDYWQQRRSVAVTVRKSGISNIVSMVRRPDAEELRQWLKNQRCRVGPVFEPAAGCFGFFVYSKRLEIRELIAEHDRYRVLH